MHPTQRAVERYHELLSRSDVAGLWQTMQAQMREHLLYFGDRPICNVLRPHFLHPQEFAYIARATEGVVSALHKLYLFLRANPETLSQLALSAGERALTQWPDYIGRPDASARMDAFWLPGERLGAGELYFLEYNADSPGGLSYSDMLTELFLQQEPMHEFLADYAVHTTPVRRKTYETLLACYREWAAHHGKTPVSHPHIAIVDWRTVRTRNEFVLMERVFESLGSYTVICDPDELEFNNGRLWVGGDFPVDIVYKRLVVNEFIQKFFPTGELLDHPLTQAMLQRAVCVVNGFNVQLLYNKALFALLSDEDHARLFSDHEQDIIRRHIPWTRLVTERRTRYGDLEIDLVGFIQRYKDELVLKPMKDYGGQGVVLGWETDQHQWEVALRVALEQPYIVQKRVPTPQANFPIYHNGLQIVPRLLDIDPYVWRGAQVAHGGVRLSTSAMLNVSAGGGSATPLFLVEEKD